MERWLTIAEVARTFRVSGEHVRRMCLSDELPAVRVGAVWRIDGAELPAFLTKSRKGGDAAEGVAGGNEDSIAKAS